MTILKFEAKKFFLNIKNILLMIVLFLSVGLFCSYEFNQLKLEREDIVAEDSFTYMHLMSDLSTIGKTHPELVATFEKSITAIEDKINYAEKGDWKNSLKSENIFLINIKKIDNLYSASYLQKYDIDKVKLNNYFLTHNLKPENSLYGVSSVYFVRKIATLIFSLYGFLFFISLFFDLFSSEIEGNHLKFLKILPLQYKYFLLAKIVLGLGLIIGIILTVFLIAFLVGFLLTEVTGTLNYPMFISNLEPNLRMLYFPKYIFHAFFPFLIVNYFILLFLIKIQNISLKSEKLLIVLLTTCSIFSIFFSMFIQTNNYYYSLLNLINIHQMIESLFSNDQLNQHVITIIFVVILVIISSNYIFKKKENSCEILS